MPRSDFAFRDERGLRASIGRRQAPAPLGPYCPACQAIPSAGHCNLKGCPMPKPEQRNG